MAPASVRPSTGGLASAEFGLVILSEVFFSKAWDNRELNGLVAREMAEGRTVILPIWHELTYDDVVRHSPPLADQRSLKFEGDLEEVVRQILVRLDLGLPYRQLHGSQRVHLTDRLGREATGVVDPQGPGGRRAPQADAGPVTDERELPTEESSAWRSKFTDRPPRRSMGSCKI